MRAAAFGWAQVQAGLVMLGADAAFGFAVVAGLVVDVTEVAAGRVSEWVSERKRE